jgi:hypothetical protein
MVVGKIFAFGEAKKKELKTKIMTKTVNNDVKKRNII